MWLLWSNLITLLATIQAALAGLMISANVFTHTQFRVIVIANAVLTAVIAQIKRNNPPGPPPEKQDDANADPARHIP